SLKPAPGLARTVPRYLPWNLIVGIYNAPNGKSRPTTQCQPQRPVEGY
ncbi:hypothetical protein GBAR_LOCUS26521, partial [Geodia barretti]